MVEITPPSPIYLFSLHKLKLFQSIYCISLFIYTLFFLTLIKLETLQSIINFVNTIIYYLIGLTAFEIQGLCEGTFRKNYNITISSHYKS